MIYVVEDDTSIRELIVYTLNSMNLKTVGFEKPSDFWDQLDSEIPTLVMLDIMLPEENGIDILKKLRKRVDTKALPIIMVTAKTSEYDRIAGLDNGADDYLVKPFHIPELLARIRALTRRPVEIKQEVPIYYSDLSFSQTERILSCGTNSLLLTARESDVLSVFLSHPQTLISREHLIYKIWGTDADIVPGNVDNYISFLRKRLKELESVCEIKTVYGSGYKLEDKDAG